MVDDNAGMRPYLKRLLQRYWHVNTAADRNDALRAIDDRAPDLVVTDMMMPGLDGRGLIQHIRTHPKAHALPVIMRRHRPVTRPAPPVSSRAPMTTSSSRSRPASCWPGWRFS